MFKPNSFGLNFFYLDGIRTAGRVYSKCALRSIFLPGVIVKHSVTERIPPLPPEKRQVSTETCRFQLYSPNGELYEPSVRDICFASDMPVGVRGEYNITETVGFNITFCVAKYITPSKTEYH